MCVLYLSYQINRNKMLSSSGYDNCDVSCYIPLICYHLIIVMGFSIYLASYNDQCTIDLLLGSKNKDSVTKLKYHNLIEKGVFYGRHLMRLI